MVGLPVFWEAKDQEGGDARVAPNSHENADAEISLWVFLVRSQMTDLSSR